MCVFIPSPSVLEGLPFFLVSVAAMAPNNESSSSVDAASTTTTTTTNSKSPSTTCVASNNVDDDSASFQTDPLSYKNNFKLDSALKRIVWRNVLLFVYLHAGFLYGSYLTFSFQINPLTFLWAVVLGVYSGLGITAGAHRLWAHRCYKARWPLRLFLCLANSMAFQNDIYEWSRDHRVHHKFTETDADPHNARRGFFFAHMGWLMCKKHPEVVRKGASVDMTDLLKDPIIRFQKRFYLTLVTLMCFVLPTWVPYAFWNEAVYKAFFIGAMSRYCVTLHCTWLVNSAAHLWGDKPYDKQINPSENLFATLMTVGEGYHNYHHTFPWDYAASEWGTKINMSTFFINLWAKLGLAYDLKRAHQDSVDKRRATKGDGSREWFQKDKVAKKDIPKLTE